MARTMQEMEEELSKIWELVGELSGESRRVGSDDPSAS